MHNLLFQARNINIGESSSKLYDINFNKCEMFVVESSPSPTSSTERVGVAYYSDHLSLWHLQHEFLVKP